MSTKETVLQKIGSTITKNSPTILTGLAVAGLVSTTVMAARATPKAMFILDDELRNRVETNQRKYNKVDVAIEPLTRKDILLLTWKCYIPAAVMGSVTIACIIGANSINLKRNAALASLYSLSETALKEYKTKVIDTIGEKKEQAIRDEIAKDKITNNPFIEENLLSTGFGEALCYDTISGRYFKSNRENINKGINKAGRDLFGSTFVSLNDVYDYIGLPTIGLGDMMGWRIDGMPEASYSSQLTAEGKPCLVMDLTRDLVYGVED